MNFIAVAFLERMMSKIVVPNKGDVLASIETSPTYLRILSGHMNSGVGKSSASGCVERYGFTYRACWFAELEIRLVLGIRVVIKGKSVHWILSCVGGLFGIHITVLLYTILRQIVHLWYFPPLLRKDQKMRIEWKFIKLQLIIQGRIIMLTKAPICNRVALFTVEWCTY